jgi:hypothetical protein
VKTVDLPMTLMSASEKITVEDVAQLEVEPSSNAGALVLRGEELDSLTTGTIWR